MVRLLGFQIFKIDAGESYWYIGKSKEDVIKFHVETSGHDLSEGIDITKVSIGEVHESTFLVTHLSDCDLHPIRESTIERDGPYHEYPMSVEVLTKVATHYAEEALGKDVGKAYLIAMSEY